MRLFLMVSTGAGSHGSLPSARFSLMWPNDALPLRTADYGASSLTGGGSRRRPFVLFWILFLRAAALVRPRFCSCFESAASNAGCVRAACEAGRFWVLAAPESSDWLEAARGCQRLSTYVESASSSLDAVKSKIGFAVKPVRYDSAVLRPARRVYIALVERAHGFIWAELEVSARRVDTFSQPNFV